jgi:hypothetical protein
LDRERKKKLGRIIGIDTLLSSADSSKLDSHISSPTGKGGKKCLAVNYNCPQCPRSGTEAAFTVFKAFTWLIINCVLKDLKLRF